jgi:hypothetical protein
MKRKLFALTITLLFIVSTVVDAQRWRTRRYESFIGIGTANVYGDIGGSLTQENLYGLRDIEIEYTRPSVSMGAKYKFNHRWNARVNLAGAYLQGSDIGSVNDGVRPGGGYNFTSYIFEPSALAEFYIIPENRSMVSEAIYNKKGMVNGFRQIYLYVFTGAGAVVNFPTVTYLNYEDTEVGDDGYQRPEDSFKRVGAVIPAGIGAKIDLTAYWTINAEFGRRFAFTDYVDGYTSKFSSANDTYDFMQVIFSYKIQTDKNGLPVIFRRLGLR